MKALQTITDEMIIHAVENSKERLVFIAPAIWPDLAQSIAKTWLRLHAENVSIVLDVNAEVCRLGYGSLEGYEILQKAAADKGQALGNEPGVRICVLISDDKTFIFSPSPRLLETSPSDQSSPSSTITRTNGICLNTPLANLNDEVGVGETKALMQTVGLDPVSQNILTDVASDLEVNPPKSFDLARAVNVYNSKIQFAELTVTGCRLSGHRAKIPTQLLSIIKQNEQLKNKITNSIKLLDKDHELVKGKALSEDAIMNLRSEIDEEFLVHVPGGTVFERARRPELKQELEKLKQMILEFARATENVLNEHFVTTADELANELVDDVRKNPPAKWKRYLSNPPTPDEIKHHIKHSLIKSFGNPATKVSRMKATLIFKDVTYEQLNDPKFTAIVASCFDLPTMEKYQAIKENSPH